MRYLHLNKRVNGAEVAYTPRRMDAAVREWCLKLRESRELTQDQLAEQTGISQGLISRIEKDPHYSPTTKVLEPFARFFGMRLSEFFRRIEQKNFAVDRKLTVPVTPRSDKSSTVQRMPAEVEPHGAAGLGLSEAELNRRIKERARAETQSYLAELGIDTTEKQSRKVSRARAKESKRRRAAH